MNRTTEIKTIFKAFGFSLLLLFFIAIGGGNIGSGTLGFKTNYKLMSYAPILENEDFPDSENRIGLSNVNDIRFYYSGELQMTESNNIDPQRSSKSISVPPNWAFLNGSMGSWINLNRPGWTISSWD